MKAVNALAPPLPRRAPLKRSFAVVAEEHLDDVHRYLLMLTADHALAEDLTAETFEKALRSWRRYDPRRSSERTWLCRIGRNLALDHFRSQSRRRRREDRYAAEDRREGAAPELGFSPELDVRAGRAQRRGARGAGAADRARPGRRGGLGRARHRPLGLLHAARAGAGEARREDGHGCPRLT